MITSKQALNRLPIAAVVLAGALALGGCSGFGTGETPTASIDPPAPAAPKVDPACVALKAQIEDLKKAQVADKLEKAGQKKGKVTPDEMTKAAQLIKANDEFSAKCTSQRTAQAAPKPQ